MGLQGQCGQVRKLSPLLEFDPGPSSTWLRFPGPCSTSSSSSSSGGGGRSCGGGGSSSSSSSNSDGGSGGGGNNNNNNNKYRVQFFGICISKPIMNRRV